MKWYIKEFSALTKVTVPTLHHYDAIGLLKPSIRLPNGYRLYSKTDLIKLERIIALKFFGFDLKKIKTLLGKDEEVATHLQFQLDFLDEQIKKLHQARRIAKSIIDDIKTDKTIDWKEVASLIKVYQMTKELKQTWAGNVYTEDELRQFAEVQEEIKKRYSQGEIKAFEEQWADLLAQAEANLDKDPAGPIGKKLGLMYVVMFKQLKEAYQNYPDLWNAIGKAFDEGKIPEDVMARKPRLWLQEAANALKKG